MVCLEVSILKSGTDFERQSATLARVEKSWRAGKSARTDGTWFGSQTERPALWWWAR